MICWAVCIFPGWPSPSVNEEETAKFKSHIRGLYDAGLPFFTKSRLEEIAQQLENSSPVDSQTRQKIFTRDLDGKQVGFSIETGRTRFGEAGKDEEFILTTPFIWYIPFQDMTSDHYVNCADVAYCNLRIYHHMELRRASDKQSIEPPSVFTLQEVQEFFQSIMKQWESSETFEQLQSTLLSLSKKTLMKINKIVVFACASLSLTDQGEKLQDSIICRRAAYQHALILTIRKLLFEIDSRYDSDPVSVACYAQDPLYTPNDKIVLQDHSITVLEDPRGFLEVDESTLIISIAPNLPVKEIIGDIARPAIMIWNRLPQKGEEGFERMTMNPNFNWPNQLASHKTDLATSNARYLIANRFQQA